MTPTDFAYRKTATEGASGFGMLIALYDTLAGDLRRAAEAERSNDLDKRSLEVNHAVLVMAYLEDWTQRGSEGDLSKQLIAFYASVRRKILEAQATRSAQMFEEQMARVLEIRGQWQRHDVHRDSERPEVLPPASGPGYLPSYGTPVERSQASWSA